MGNPATNDSSLPHRKTRFVALQRRGLEESERRAVVERIRHVVENGLLEPVFQPIVDLSTGGVIGFEALTRFDLAPERPPQWWFSAADAVGLRQELELAAACVAVDEFCASGRSGFVSLNASPDVLLPALASIPDDFRDRLVIEVTEHAAIDDYEAIIASLTNVRAEGLRLAVDDAGAGFASFRHVLELSPDFVKLDVSLTRGILCVELRGQRVDARAIGLADLTH